MGAEHREILRAALRPGRVGQASRSGSRVCRTWEPTRTSREAANVPAASRGERRQRPLLTLTASDP